MINDNLNSSELKLGSYLQNVENRFLKNSETQESDKTQNIIQSFGDVLKGHIEKTSSLQQEAEHAAKTFAVGGNIELHNVMIAAEKADVALQMTLQLRNKLVDAYREIYNMQV